MGDAPPFIILSLVIALMAFAILILREIEGFQKVFDEEQMKWDPELTEIVSYELGPFPISITFTIRFSLIINSLLFTIICARIYLNQHLTLQDLSILDHIIMGSIWFESLLLLSWSIYYAYRRELSMPLRFGREMFNFPVDDEDNFD